MNYKAPLSIISDLLNRNSIQQVCLNNRIVYSTYFTNIVFGLLLERSPYKNSFYLRRLILPLFMNLDELHLVYSRRLPNAQSSRVIFEGSANKVASEVMASLHATGLVAELSRRYTPEQFLIEYGSQQRDSRALAHALTRVQLFDLASAAALVGDQSLADLYMDACEEHLLQISSKLPVGDPFPSDVHALSSALKTDRAFAVRLLERNAAASAVRLGFHPRPSSTGKR